MSAVGGIARALIGRPVVPSGAPDEGALRPAPSQAVDDLPPRVSSLRGGHLPYGLFRLTPPL